jgi:phage terminase large subunit GpA-like protein
MLLSNPERVAIEAVAAGLEPPPTLDLLSWAERNVVFDDGPFKGPYNRQLFPFFDEPLRSLSPSDSCRNVTVMASAQVGKTALATIAILGWMSTSRGSFMVCHPTEETATRWARFDEIDGDCARSLPATSQRAACVDSLQGTKGRFVSLVDHGRE